MDIIETIEFKDAYDEWVAVWTVKSSAKPIPNYRFSHRDHETFLANLPSQRAAAKEHFDIIEKGAKHS